MWARTSLTPWRPGRNGLQAQLSEANGKLEGYDPEWKAKAQQMQQEANQKVEAVRFDYALKAALTAAKAKNPELVAKSINRDALKLTDAGLWAWRSS